MHILKKYILSEWFSLFLLSLVIISFVLVIGNVFKMVELIVAKGVDPVSVGKLFAYLLPSLLIFSIPISVLTGTLLGFGRLSSDNEITAMRASGISLFYIIFDLLLIAGLLSGICLYCNDTLIPQSHFQVRRIMKEIGLKQPTAYLEERTFIKAFQDHIIFIYRIKGNRLEGIRIYQPQGEKPTRTIIAESGEFISIPEKNAVKLILRKGIADEPNFEDPEMFYKVKFKTYRLPLQLEKNDSPQKINKKISEMSSREIREEITKMRRLSVDPTPLIVGLHKKLALSFSSLAFTLIGIPLAIKLNRRERSLGFGLSLIICLIYYMLMVLGEGLAIRGTIDPITGIWLPNTLLAVAGIYLIYKVVEK